MEAKDYVAAIRVRGLTQAQIADKTGIPQPTISKIERGDVSDVMSRNYRALQNLYIELAQAQQTPAQDAPESVAASAEALPPICDLPPIVATPTAPAWDGIDRRGPVGRPMPPELDRRAALAGGV